MFARERAKAGQRPHQGRVPRHGRPDQGPRPRRRHPRASGEEPAHRRGQVPRGQQAPVQRGRPLGQGSRRPRDRGHRRQSDQNVVEPRRSRQARPRASPGDRHDPIAAARPRDQAARGRRGARLLALAPRVDDPRRRARHLPRAPAHGPARRRTLRHLGPQRPLPTHHQPQQPAEEDHRDPRAGVDHQP